MIRCAVLAVVLSFLFFPLSPVFASDIKKISAYDWMCADPVWVETLKKEEGPFYIDEIPVVAGEPVVKPIVTITDVRNYISSKMRVFKDTDKFKEILDQIKSRVVIKPPSVYELREELDRLYAVSQYSKTINGMLYLISSDSTRKQNMRWIDVWVYLGVEVERTDFSQVLFFDRNSDGFLEYYPNCREELVRLGVFNVKLSS